MNKRILHIISVFFITLLLAKGTGSLAPLFFSTNDDGIQIELLSENEPEEQKNKESKSFETNPTEELFDHLFHASHFTYIKAGDRISASSAKDFLPHVCLDIPTPPPNYTSLS